MRYAQRVGFKKRKKRLAVGGRFSFKREKRSKQEGWNEREKEEARTIGGERRFGHRLEEKQRGKLSFF